MKAIRGSSRGLLLLVSALWLAGCGGGVLGPTPTPASIAHPTGARDVVIQLRTGGGGPVPSPLYLITDRFPGFTLSGDGTWLYQIGDGYYQTRLDEATIQRLLVMARDEVQFATLDEFLGPTCCDMPNSELTINAAGQSHSVSFSILDEPPTPTAQQTPAQRLARLLAALNDLRRADGPRYEPPGVTLYATGGTPVAAGDDVPAWPVAEVALQDAWQASEGPDQTWIGQGLRLTGAPAQAVLRAAPRVQQFAQAGMRYFVVAVPDIP
jgi:hypothetical protein